MQPTFVSIQVQPKRATIMFKSYPIGNLVNHVCQSMEKKLKIISSNDTLDN